MAQRGGDNHQAQASSRLGNRGGCFTDLKHGSLPPRNVCSQERLSSPISTLSGSILHEPSFHGSQVSIPRFYQRLISATDDTIFNHPLAVGRPLPCIPDLSSISLSQTSSHESLRVTSTSSMAPNLGQASSFGFKPPAFRGASPGSPSSTAAAAAAAKPHETDFHIKHPRTRTAPLPQYRGRIAVVVPVYNEDPCELQRTLMSLAYCVQTLRTKCSQPLSKGGMGFTPEVKVLVVQDGWTKAHPDFLAFLEAMFPPEEWEVGCTDLSMPNPSSCPTYHDSREAIHNGNSQENTANPHLRPPHISEVQVAPRGHCELDGTNPTLQAENPVELSFVDIAKTTPAPGPTVSETSHQTLPSQCKAPLCTSSKLPHTKTDVPPCWNTFLVPGSSFESRKGNNLLISCMPHTEVDLTAYLQPPTYFGADSGRNTHSALLTLNLSVLIKSDNRRKHNSHEWFLQAFATECFAIHNSEEDPDLIQADYVFCTDCGTIFDNSMLWQLFEKVFHNHNLCSVTGRARVMTFDMQNAEAFIFDHKGLAHINQQQLSPGARGTQWWRHAKSFLNCDICCHCPRENASCCCECCCSFNLNRACGYTPRNTEPLLDAYIRLVQRYDVDVSAESYMGVFYLLGILVVIPGPCGLYRFDLLRKRSKRATELIEEMRMKEGVQIYKGSLCTTSSLRTSFGGLGLDSIRQGKVYGAGNNISEHHGWKCDDKVGVMYERPSNNASQVIAPFLDTFAFETRDAQKSKADQTLFDTSSTALVHRRSSFDSNLAAALDFDSNGIETIRSIREASYRTRSIRRNDSLRGLGGSSFENTYTFLDSAEVIRSMKAETSPKYSPLDWYFEIVTASDMNRGIVLGNMQIAEDRVLTHAAVFAVDQSYSQTAVPTAHYYFEAETDLRKLIAQRRRWINGSWASYIYVLWPGQSSVLSRAPIGFFRKIAVYFFFILQLLMCVASLLSESMFLLILLSTERSLFPGNYAGQDLLKMLWYLAIALYVTFVVRHCLYSPYDAWLCWLSMLLNSIIIAFMILATVQEVLNGSLLYFDNWFDPGYMFFATALLFLMPALIALIHDPLISISMLLSLISYIFFQPTLIVMFSAYAFSRMHDLSWGNRPDGGAEGIAAQVQAELRAKSFTISIIIVVLNVILAYVIDAFSNKWIVLYGIFVLNVALGSIQIPGSILFYFFHVVTRIFNLLIVTPFTYIVSRTCYSCKSTWNDKDDGDDNCEKGNPGRLRREKGIRKHLDKELEGVTDHWDSGAKKLHNIERPLPGTIVPPLAQSDAIRSNANRCEVADLEAIMTSCTNDESKSGAPQSKHLEATLPPTPGDLSSQPNRGGATGLKRYYGRPQAPRRVTESSSLLH